MSDRIQKVNSLIQKNLSELISKELSLKNGVFLTIARVDTSRDLKIVRVSISTFPDSEVNYVKKTLEKERGRLQKLLNKKLYMKPLPKLVFRLDDTEYHADEIEKILYSIEQERDGESDTDTGSK